VSEPLKYIPAEQVRATLPEGAAHLRVEIADFLCIPNAIIRRAFPVSSTDRFISIQDAAGKEIGLIADLANMHHETRRLLERDLDRRYFTPKILSVQQLKQEGGMWTFHATTQRGSTVFHVRNWRDSAHEIQPGRWQIHSVDGQRFEIPNLTALDDRSQILMEQLF
jgi:hypothetical protein